MKSIKRIFVAMMLVLAVGVAANSQVRFGVKAGVAVNDLKFDKDVLSASNRAGFTGGLMLEFNVPVINLGFDASVMYVRRTSEVGGNLNDVEKTGNLNRDYIEVPINVKYKFGLPVVGKVVTPYIFTGPSFAFLTSKEAIGEAYKNKKFDVAWNFGLGVQLLNKVQIGASYGLGLTKTLETLGADVNAAGIEGKNRYWTITAAYLF